jgi:hypothetical protein
MRLKIKAGPFIRMSFARPPPVFTSFAAKVVFLEVGPPPHIWHNPFLDPLLWLQACSDPHAIKPVFGVDLENDCFQDLNRSSSGSKVVLWTFSGAVLPNVGVNPFLDPCLDLGLL